MAQGTRARWPHPACCLFVWIKLYWDAATLFHLHIVQGRFHTAVVTLSGCDRHSTPDKAEVVYYVALYWKKKVWWLLLRAVFILGVCVGSHVTDTLSWRLSVGLSKETWGTRPEISWDIWAEFSWVWGRRLGESWGGIPRGSEESGPGGMEGLGDGGSWGHEWGWTFRVKRKDQLWASGLQAVSCSCSGESKRGRRQEPRPPGRENPQQRQMLLRRARS